MRRGIRGSTPRIVITLQAPDRRPDPASTVVKNERYLECLRRAGAEPVPLDEHASASERADAFEAMEGLLLSGGADLDPALYGQAVDGAVDIEPGRDELELQAWRAAERRGVPVLGVCRGLEAINVFSGGSLIQHLEDHVGAEYPSAEGLRHPLRLRAGSRLARVLRPVDPAGGVISVNSFHHQAVPLSGLAPGLLASGTSPSSHGPIVEGLEAEDPARFVMAVQCHPERYESSPLEFERLWSVFVDAARGGSRP
jgi:putative glutamine amidotransferase